MGQGRPAPWAHVMCLPPSLTHAKRGAARRAAGTTDRYYVSGGVSMTAEQKNMELMQTLDDAWNTQDWDTFDKRHKADVVVRWPAQPPTHGRHDHRAEGV